MKLVVSEKNLGVGDRSGESVAFGFKTCSVKKKKKKRNQLKLSGKYLVIKLVAQKPWSVECMGLVRATCCCHQLFLGCPDPGPATSHLSPQEGRRREVSFFFHVYFQLSSPIGWGEGKV